MRVFLSFYDWQECSLYIGNLAIKNERLYGALLFGAAASKCAKPKAQTATST
jgi:hypothetical protein